MRRPKFVTAKQAVDMIPDGSTVGTVAMTLISCAESILTEIEDRFLAEGHPRDLTLVHSCGQSDGVRGVGHFAHEGLVTKVIGGHWGLCPPMMDFIGSNKTIAYNIPQGQFAQLFRSMSGGDAGKITKVGLGTYIDPRYGGGKMNERTQSEPDIHEVVTIDGEEYMRYKPIPMDFLIIRGTHVDELGNLTTDEELMMLEVWPAVQACKKYGGKVIAQAKYKVKEGTLHPKRVTVPGVFIDAVVICDDPERDHRMTNAFFMDPAYSGDIREPDAAPPPVPLDMRKVIGRRATMEIAKEDILNVGTGIPNDTVGSVLAEEGMNKEVMLTVESGMYGGLPLGGYDFGIAKNNYAFVRHDDQFDFYNGAGADVTFMGAGEMDPDGNVNATKLGPKPTGAGGFIDITQNAKHVVFCSTFTGKGLKCSFKDNKLHIDQEGSLTKLVNKVQQISYNGKMARERGQKMHYVTERAVFELRPEGPVLIEIAPGIDLQKDVLDKMEFKPIIADDLKEMNPRLFGEEAFGLKDLMKDAEK